ncbi:MAG: HAD family phosphatase [Ruminococcaceae bacterium]|nr:HAD family phosphatase [Oscillospiraceae bacterium]
MIKNIVFDFGRVIVDFEETKMTRAYVKDESMVETVRDTVFDRLYWDRLDLGTITDDELKACVAARLPKEFVSAAHAVYNRWIHHIDPIPGIEDAVRTARERAEGLYLLSNISIKFAEEYKQNPAIDRILSLFDGLVFSGPLHMIKPDARIFHYLLDTYGLKADECLFIDDSPKNIAGAQKLGIQTYLFDGDTKKLKEYIKSIF